jgi:ActR/RegA family two-component response regulator
MACGALRVLAVEDEPLLGMELEEVVTLAGHKVIGCATSSASAIAFAEVRSPQFAFVDLRLLDGETGLGISQQLSERGVAVVFTTAEADQVSNKEHALGVMPKPYQMETIAAVLNYAAQILEGTAPDPEAPAGFRKLNFRGAAFARKIKKGRREGLVRWRRCTPYRSRTLDRKAVVVDDRGVTDVERLRAALPGAATRRRPFFNAFDLLALNSDDLRQCPGAAAS